MFILNLLTNYFNYNEWMFLLHKKYKKDPCINGGLSSWINDNYAYEKYNYPYKIIPNIFKTKTQFQFEMGNENKTILETKSPLAIIISDNMSDQEQRILSDGIANHTFLISPANKLPIHICPLNQYSQNYRRVLAIRENRIVKYNSVDIKTDTFDFVKNASGVDFYDIGDIKYKTTTTNTGHESERERDIIFQIDANLTGLVNTNGDIDFEWIDGICSLPFIKGIELSLNADVNFPFVFENLPLGNKYEQISSFIKQLKSLNCFRQRKLLFGIKSHYYNSQTQHEIERLIELNSVDYLHLSENLSDFNSNIIDVLGLIKKSKKYKLIVSDGLITPELGIIALSLGADMIASEIGPKISIDYNKKYYYRLDKFKDYLSRYQLGINNYLGMLGVSYENNYIRPNINNLRTNVNSN